MSKLRHFRPACWEANPKCEFTQLTPVTPPLPYMLKQNVASSDVMPSWRSEASTEMGVPRTKFGITQF